MISHYAQRVTRRSPASILLLIAGHETTVNLITGGALTLAQRPDDQAKLRQERNLLRTGVEEMVRFVSPVGSDGRSLIGDIELDDGSAGKNEPGLKLREADLTKHLDGDKEAKAEPKAATPATPAPNSYNFVAAPRQKDVPEKDLKVEPGEVVAKYDYELSQAVAFLKSRDTTQTTSAGAATTTN